MPRVTAMLHIFNNFPIDRSRLEQTACGDTVLFTENAVYAVKKNNKSDKIINKATRHPHFCVLGSDLSMRGVSLSEIFHNVSIIDDRDYNTITEEKTIFRSCN